jgi:deoxyribose-phosphate aldolase
MLSTLSKRFDHTLLKAECTKDQIADLVREAVQHNFASVCVNSGWVKTASDFIKEREGTVIVCAVVGFPLGAMSTISKVAGKNLFPPLTPSPLSVEHVFINIIQFNSTSQIECNDCIANGAREIDVVLNVGFLKSGMVSEAQFDLESVINACHRQGVLCKVILEVCLLNEDQIKTASTIALDAGADFIKTSTGFSTGGATLESVELMVQLAGKRGKEVKASGGIRDGKTAVTFLNAGATRLGTSATVKAYQEARKILEDGGSSGAVAIDGSGGY